MASWDAIVAVIKRLLQDGDLDSGGPDLDTFETPDALVGRQGRGRQQIVEVLEQAVGRGFVPNSLHRLLGDIPQRTSLTTNWDTLLEDAFLAGGRTNVIYDDETARTWRESQGTQVIKFHGTIRVPSSIVFGLGDYARIYQRPSLLMSLVRTIVSTRPILSLGFGMRDTFVRAMLTAVSEDGGGEHYVVATEQQLDRVRRRYLEDVGVTVVEMPSTSGDPFGLHGFLEELRAQTHTEARGRVERTRLLIRETDRLNLYLGADPTIRARAALGPLAVPDSNALNVFGSQEVFDTERALLDTVVQVLKGGRARLRLICSPLDGGEHAAAKGYTSESYRARVGGFLKWAEALGSSVEIATADRPSDVNDWIVADVALVESRKSAERDGRLYEYGRLELDPNVVRAAVVRFDEQFNSLSQAAGGTAASREAFIEGARTYMG